MTEPWERWECVITADEPPGDLPWQGRYVYDPLAIRPRHGDDAPALRAPASVLHARALGATRAATAAAGEEARYAETRASGLAPGSYTRPPSSSERTGTPPPRLMNGGDSPGR